MTRDDIMRKTGRRPGLAIFARDGARLSQPQHAPLVLRLWNFFDRFSISNLLRLGQPRSGIVLGLALLCLWTLCGCCTRRPNLVSSRHFEFQKDTFAFPNELVWIYEYDANGKWKTRPRLPKPTYWQHCFVLSRAARQFFVNAKFDPELPKADEQTYRRLIQRVVATDLRHPRAEKDKIVIPGYTDLRGFSETCEQLLKLNCGSGWQSYFQRGHWHVVIPFTRHSQQQMATRLMADLAKNDAPVVHLVRFPQLTINHAVVFFDAKEDAINIVFSIYDPNLPSEPRLINYDKKTRAFIFPPNNYFPGGRVDVYEIFNGWLY